MREGTWYLDETLSDTVGGGTGASGAPPVGNTNPTLAAPYVPPASAPGSECFKNDTIPDTLSGTVQLEKDLPATPADGLLYKVMGSADSNFQSYYVISKGGVWNETRAPGLKNAIKSTTMPHALIRKSDGTFEFKPFCWKPRSVGDKTSNPAPAFVGKVIRDVFFYQNRLGFAVDEAVVMSVVGDYGNFWRRTVLDALDADALSVSATTTDVALLDYATAFNDGIMLFSAKRQLSLSNGQSGTSINSIEIRPVTDYSLAPGVRPAPYGDTVYFAAAAGGYTSILEYTRLDGRDAKDAADITAHVPGLIPEGVSKLVPLHGVRGLVALASNSTTPGQVYTYQFYWDADQKVLSSWKRWSFSGGHVISGDFADGQLTLVVRRSNKAYLEKIDLRQDAVAPQQDHQIYLDRLVTLTGTYNAGTGLTTFTFPYEPDPVRLRLVRTKGHPYPESLIDGTKVTVSGTTVTVEGNESAHPVTAGEVYKTALVLSRQFPRDYQGRPLESGRLQLRSMSITTSETPFFTVEIYPYGRDANLDDASKRRVYNVSSQRIGYSGFLLGAQAYASDAIPFSVSAEASRLSITLANDTPFASSWVSAEWEGLYFNRAS
ncbi:phage nozzle protein [Novosphingobium meiothermophilum]|uniref:phage nozzle protein n=1 Tax=Novosphingobium meiothermophilum TaxID=2202251 RepID=UPI000D6E697F|nr:hypothetical protein [Novosphingobium meiothermophilum]